MEIKGLEHIEFCILKEEMKLINLISNLSN